MLFIAHFEKKMWVPKKTLNVRGFFKRGIYEKSASIFFARIILEKRVLLRAFKIRRGFWSRAFQIFSDKKASKTVILEIEKSEEKKKPMDTLGCSKITLCFRR